MARRAYLTWNTQHTTHYASFQSCLKVVRRPQAPWNVHELIHTERDTKINVCTCVPTCKICRVFVFNLQLVQDVAIMEFTVGCLFGAYGVATVRVRVPQLLLLHSISRRHGTIADNCAQLLP